MKTLKRPKVFIAWGRGWAFQAYWYPTLSLGVSIDFSRTMIDIHFLFFTLALGPDSHITSQKDRHRHSCRGFLFASEPQL